jgi:hypothetical protein
LTDQGTNFVFPSRRMGGICLDMDVDDISRRAPLAWAAAIAQGEADLASGRVSEPEPFIAGA